MKLIKKALIALNLNFNLNFKLLTLSFALLSLSFTLLNFTNLANTTLVSNLVSTLTSAFDSTLNSSKPLVAVYAQEPIEINIGDVAKEREVVGTQNYDPEDGNAGFALLLSKILNIVVVVAALIVFLYLIWGGIEWITSGGDKGKTEKARNRISGAILGLVVLAGMIALFLFLQLALGFEVITFLSGEE